MRRRERKREREEKKKVKCVYWTIGEPIEQKYVEIMRILTYIYIYICMGESCVYFITVLYYIVNGPMSPVNSVYYYKNNLYGV